MHAVGADWARGHKSALKMQKANSKKPQKALESGLCCYIGQELIKI